MCGLAGFAAASAATVEELTCTVRRMCDAIAHRGPDRSGEWLDVECGIALGFRRLAIMDLSPAGDQPMASASGRYVATLNGEIYNCGELRRAIEDAGGVPAYRGHSDTEAMLAAFDTWGLPSAVPRFNGMFAIAVWDRLRRRLHLVRDRMGVKPLYYGVAGRSFVYGSELGAFRQHPEFEARISLRALHLYLRFLSVPEPHCIYDGVAKLMPGTILTFDPGARTIGTTTYWSVLDVVARGVGNRFQGSEAEAAHEVERLATDAVHRCMIADVPVGVFLSGGIDSSLVTALMQSGSSAPVRSFAVGFTDAAYDEARFARPVAAHLGTDHTDVFMTEHDVLDTIPRLPFMYDEPFADSSQIPTHLLSVVARRHVTVSLSGDGGDELFGGYVRYIEGQRVLRWCAAAPLRVRRALGRALTLLPPPAWNRLLALTGPLLPGSLRRPATGERMHKLSRVLEATNQDALYFELVSHWPELADATLSAEAPVTQCAHSLPVDDPVERMMFFDQISYLPNDILTKVDRASMAVSLEARVPLLDYRLVEFAWTLPLSMKVSRGKGKHLLRRILKRYVPDALIDRPKMGFGVPLDDWLRTLLRDWAESLLDSRVIAGQGFLDPAPIRAKWNDHLARRGDWKHELWAMLMLQAWLQEHRYTTPVAASIR